MWYILFQAQWNRCDQHNHQTGGRRGRGRMVVGFITIYAISAYHH
jgi:hypothetical protein